MELEHIAQETKPKLSEKELKLIEAEKRMLIKYMMIEAALLIPTGIALAYSMFPNTTNNVIKYLFGP